MLIIDEIFRPSLRNLRVILAVIHVNNTDLFWWRIFFANILNDLSKMLRPIFKHFLPSSSFLSYSSGLKRMTT